MLGEALVHKQIELVLPKEGQGMQEQHTSAHVRGSSKVSMNVHRAGPIFRMFRATSSTVLLNQLLTKNSAPKEVLFTVAEHK